MRVLITGGSGFLGRALTARLREDGAQVAWLARDPAAVAVEGVPAYGYDALVDGPLAGDRFDAAGVAGTGTGTSIDALQPFDAVVNLAGAGIADRPWTPARRRLLLESRLRPTAAVVDWISRMPADARPRLLLSGSAIGWYGAQGDVALDESSAPRIEFQHALCAAWEDEARRAEALGVTVVLLRTGVVLHRDGGMLAKLRTPFSLGLGARLGNGAQVLSWIARDDWVDAACWLLRARFALKPGEAPMSGPVNLTSPEPARNGEFTAAWAKALHRPALFGMPAFALRAGLGEMATLLVDGQRVLPRRLLDAGFAFRHPHLAPWLQAQAGRD